MKYDDLDYHVGGDFPEDVSEEHGWTHIGVFLLWIIGHDLHDARWEPLSDVAVRVRERSLEPADLMNDCDGKLIDDMLSEAGNAFSRAVYDRYVELYDETMADHVNASRSLLARLTREQLTAYHADPGWPTYDVIAPVIDALYEEWKAGRKPAPEGAWTRNYRAMGDEKLLRCVGELRDRSGDAFDRVLARAADPDVHLVSAEQVARERGLL